MYATQNLILQEPYNVVPNKKLNRQSRNQDVFFYVIEDVNQILSTLNIKTSIGTSYQNHIPTSDKNDGDSFCPKEVCVRS